MKMRSFLGIILARKGSAVWSISPDATVFKAIQLMDDKNVGALPVVDNWRLIGIISERDYTRKVILKGLSAKDTPVRDIMTREVLTASPRDSIEDCMRVMTEKRVRHLPVLEGTKMIGIVSIGDIMKWVISAQADETERIQRYVLNDHQYINFP
jgi:CBS domain-containing protein